MRFTPVDTETGFRLELDLSRAEMMEFDLLPPGRSGKTTVVTDESGQKWETQRKPCGLGCHCDAWATAVQ